MSLHHTTEECRKATSELGPANPTPECKPCPFCGSPGVKRGEYAACGDTTGSCWIRGEDTHPERWNRRVAAPALAADLRGVVLRFAMDEWERTRRKNPKAGEPPWGELTLQARGVWLKECEDCVARIAALLRAGAGGPAGAHDG